MNDLEVVLKRWLEKGATFLNNPRLPDDHVEAYFRRFDRLMVELLLKLEQGAAVDSVAPLLGQLADYRGLLRGKVASECGRARLNSLARPGQLVVMLTRRCQLRCVYCGIGDYDGTMNEATLRRAVEFLFASSRRSLRLQFFGGEPALEFRLIRKAVGWIGALSRSSGKEVRLMVTTNGLLLTSEMLAFYRKHDFLVDLSWDGAPSTQLQNRRSKAGRDYYPRLLKNTETLRSSGVPYQLTMVVPPESVETMFANVEFLVARGHRRIQINYAGACFWPLAKIHELLRQIERIRLAAANWPDFELINSSELRWEPALLNSNIVVDFDGTIFRDMGFYQKSDRAVAIGPIGKTEGLDDLGLTPFETFWRLKSIFAREEAFFAMRLLVNNLVVGKLFELSCRRFSDSRSVSLDEGPILVTR